MTISDPLTPLSTRPREERDLGMIVGWVPDADALYLFTGPRLTWPLTAAQLRESTDAEGRTASVVVSSSGEPVGHFDLVIDGGVARLGRVIIAPAFRGRGLAAELVALAVREARSAGADRLRLNVILTNTRALRTYVRAGFVEVPGASDRADMTVMERSLRAVKVLVTGMSGAGKSTLLDALARRGHRTIDTDFDGWVLADGRWDEPRMGALLAQSGTLVVSGTVENQGAFYDRFDHVVLLSAPVDALIERVRARTNNPYGRSPEDQEEIHRYVREVEPLLRAGASLELDARRPSDELADEVEALVRG